MTADLVVVGGGVVGLTAALAFRSRHSDASVVVLEKESAVGQHASGRNSGVLHAGFYYSPDSIKARFSRDGCAAWTEFCEEHDLPLRRCGKLVVARSEAQHDALDELHRRGVANGVDVQIVNAGDAMAIEPRAKTVGKALWSPTTASVDPRAVMVKLAERARDVGIDIRLSTPFTGRDGDVVLTGDGPIDAGLVLNAAGLQADRVAARWGCGERYRIAPFKGLYLLGDEPPGGLRVHVYPVPDLGMPFLGTHLTVTVDGGVKIGPTALPALWRENYAGLDRFDGRELLGVLARDAKMMLRSRGFARLALRETAKASRRVLLGQARELVSGIDANQWRTWGRPGIRAQLLDTTTDELVMDFVVERAERSLHVLNAVSPAFTCALPFAEHLCDQLEQCR